MLWRLQMESISRQPSIYVLHMESLRGTGPSSLAPIHPSLKFVTAFSVIETAKLILSRLSGRGTGRLAKLKEYQFQLVPSSLARLVISTTLSIDHGLRPSFKRSSRSQELWSTSTFQLNATGSTISSRRQRLLVTQ